MAGRVNFIKHIKVKRRLDIKAFVGAIVLCFVALIAISSSEIKKNATFARKVESENRLIDKLNTQLQEKLVNDNGSKLVAVVEKRLKFFRLAFYLLFEELSQIDVKGVWITRFEATTIDQHLEINGSTFSTEKLDEFLDAIKKQKRIGLLKYRGVDVSKGKLPALPYGVETSLVVPEIYDFTIKTKEISDSEYADIKKELKL